MFLIHLEHYWRDSHCVATVKCLSMTYLPGLDCKPTSDRSCASKDANVGFASLNARSAGVVKPANSPDWDGVDTAGPLGTPDTEEYKTCC